MMSCSTFDGAAAPAAEASASASAGSPNLVSLNCGCWRAAGNASSGPHRTTWTAQGFRDSHGVGGRVRKRRGPLRRHHQQAASAAPPPAGGCSSHREHSEQQLRRLKSGEGKKDIARPAASLPPRSDRTTPATSANRPSCAYESAPPARIPRFLI